MCERPITQENRTFACRTCNECIGTRQHGWVSRAMAEKAMARHALVVALTYNDDTPENRDSARMFNYADVAAFLKRLRSRITDSGREGGVRFIIAGEQGSRNGRCHWHAILFSEVDLTSCGTFTYRGNTLTKRDEMISSGKNIRRLEWSLWGRGFVTLQEPDQAGMHYVLKYCLKDQFTEEKSMGTMRQAKAENFATGLFRMSKLPPIGAAWLAAKLDRLDALGAVLPNLQLKIPDMSGYWHPNGAMREMLLRGLVAINDRHRMTTGQDTAQWSSLLASCADSEKDLEVLLEETSGDFAAVLGRQLTEERAFARELGTKSGERSRQGRIAATVRSCGRKYPCARCLRAVDQGTLDRLDLEETPRGSIDGQEYADFREKSSGLWLSDKGVNPLAGGLNAFCGLADTDRAREAFPASFAGRGSRGSGHV